MAIDEERRRSTKNHTQTLPLELIREILLRLPVRSVLRFKCVCKSWLSLISDPQFGISHYDLAAAPSHRLIIRSNDFYTQSVDIESVFKTQNRGVVYFPLPLPSPPCDDHYFEDFCNQPKILGSCRGLILLYYQITTDLILWNPSLGVHKRLLNFEDIPFHFLYGFGYDASTDDYLLTLIGLPEFERETSTEVFSFKTESWKSDLIVNVSYEDLERIYNMFTVEEKFRAGSLLNGALHWLVFSKDKMVPVIIAFDLIQRSLSEIPLCNHLTMEKYQLYSLRVMGGCLSVCCSDQGCGPPEIWVMKEYKMQSSWTKSTVKPTYDFSPICITKDGGIFGSKSTARGRLEKLNDKGELLHYHYYGGDRGLYCANLQSAMYRESLLALPIVIQKTWKYEYHRETRKDDRQETSEDDHQEASEDDQRESSKDDQRISSEDDQQ